MGGEGGGGEGGGGRGEGGGGEGGGGRGGGGWFIHQCVIYGVVGKVSQVSKTGVAIDEFRGRAQLQIIVHH